MLSIIIILLLLLLLSLLIVTNVFPSSPFAHVYINSRLLKTEGRADRIAKGYKFICPIFRLDKPRLHQGLEKLSENRITAVTVLKIR